jgi:hypothetical protein
MSRNTRDALGSLVKRRDAPRQVNREDSLCQAVEYDLMLFSN